MHLLERPLLLETPNPLFKTQIKCFPSNASQFSILNSSQGTCHMDLPVCVGDLMSTGSQPLASRHAQLVLGDRTQESAATVGPVDAG